jgi:enoyl-CoA hydratase
MLAKQMQAPHDRRIRYLQYRALLAGVKSMSPNFETLRVAFDGAIACLTLNRPEKGNAFDADMHREFPEALALIEANQDIRVMLLMGEGKTFSAGGDFSFIRQLRSETILREQSFDEGMAIVERMANMRVPIITAVHGHAMGIGATLVALSDISVAWKDAKIADPHVQIGLVAGDGGVIGWSSAIGFNRAKRYLLTGEALTGAQAHALGLVTDLADTAEEAKAQARALAEKIAALPPIAVQGTKRAFNALAAVRNGDAQRVAFEEEHIALMSDDLEEAMNAMTERRPGRFTNT